MKVNNMSEPRKVSIRNSYKFYRENSNFSNKLTRNDYLKIVGDYNKFLMTKVLEGYVVSLPYRFGILFVRGRIPKVYIDDNGKIKGYAPDWKKTLNINKGNDKLEKKVYHMNEHSNGVIYKYVWMKFNVFIKNKKYYTLKMSRYNKRELSKYIKNGKEYPIK